MDLLTIINTTVGFISLFFSVYTAYSARDIKKKIRQTEDITLLKQEKQELLGQLSLLHQKLNTEKFLPENQTELLNLIIDISSGYQTIFSEDENCTYLMKELKKDTIDSVQVRLLVGNIISKLKRG